MDFTCNLFPPVFVRSPELRTALLTIHEPSIASLSLEWPGYSRPATIELDLLKLEQLLVTACSLYRSNPGGGQEKCPLDSFTMTGPRSTLCRPDVHFPGKFYSSKFHSSHSSNLRAMLGALSPSGNDEADT